MSDHFDPDLEGLDARDERCPECNTMVWYPATCCPMCGPWDERHGVGLAGPIDEPDPEPPSCPCDRCMGVEDLDYLVSGDA